MQYKNERCEMRKKNLKSKRLKKCIDKQAKLVLCAYCKSKDKCSKRERKERDEARHIRTFCLLSPNKSARTYQYVYKRDVKNRY